MNSQGWQLVVDCRALSFDRRDLVAGSLWCHPITAIEERADELVVGFATEADARTAARELPAPWRVEEVVDDSYLDEWRRYAQPWTVGRLFVRPSWVETAGPAGTIALVIDPGRTFGSGGHPSTRLALALMQQHDLRDRSVLDVGCGSGVLAIAAVVLGASRAVAIDIDASAVAVTLANARLNDVCERVDAVVASPHDLEARSDLAAPIDLVVANVLPSLHRSVARTLARLSRTVIVAGLLDAQRDEVVAAYGARCVAMQSDEGWSALTLETS
jgi:ribosomal protein L11 methyltransferase